MPARTTEGSPSLRQVGDRGVPSEEMLALMEFASRLRACNVNTIANGIADDEEGNTRKGATLLMSLLASPLRFDERYDLDPVSASESEQSFTSESSSSRRDLFTFTCPSLSLDSSNFLDASKFPLRIKPNSNGDEPPILFIPATLFGRPLKVDDRDALRLSADAMVRNLSQSFQRALRWRIQSWVSTLSEALVLHKQYILAEEKVIQSEADLERQLSGSAEASLILHLCDVDASIKVTSSRIDFTVGPLSKKTYNREPAPKKQRLDDKELSSDLEDGDYLYEVSHSLTMECYLNLDTPAGFSEVSMQVPGIIEGVFLSSETGMEELRSVKIELDTGILAAMVEKSCRTVVRASVETLSLHSKANSPPDSTPLVPLSMSLPSPAPCHDSPIDSDLHGRFVTSHNLSSTDIVKKSFHPFSSQPSAFPIPDDLEYKSETPGQRHISHSPRQTNAGAYTYHLASLSPTPTSETKFNEYKDFPSLVSPPSNEGEFQYHESCVDGPSFPVLMEAACRVLEK